MMDREQMGERVQLRLDWLRNIDDEIERRERLLDGRRQSARRAAVDPAGDG